MKKEIKKKRGGRCMEENNLIIYKNNEGDTEK